MKKSFGKIIDNATTYILVGIKDQEISGKTFDSRQEALAAAFRHVQDNQALLIVDLNTGKFSKLGDTDLSPADLKELLLDRGILKEENPGASEGTYCVYCHDCKDVLKGSGGKSEAEAQEIADEHYIKTGGPDGGHSAEPRGEQTS